MSSSSDDELMIQVVAQDETAYTELMDRHLNALYAFIYRFCDNPSDAEDLTQTTLMRVWERAGTWRAGKVRFKTWLFQIARNLCIDEFRRQSRYETSDVDPEDLHREDGKSLEQEEKVEALRKEMSALPERQRTALELCSIQGWSQSDAAEILGCSVDAIDALLGRGRRTLRLRMARFRD